MKITCIKDVVVSGKTVYEAGKEYSIKDILENGKVKGWEISSNYGKGVFIKGDPALKQHFKTIKKEEALKDEKPSVLDKVIGLFKKPLN